MSARPVQNSIGEQLLRQMGWKDGEGLGKNKDGKRQPVHVDIKVDRKGELPRLVSFLSILVSENNFIFNESYDILM